MRTAVQVLTILCALGAATVAGTFFTFSTFTIAGLKRLGPAEGAAAMQAINEEAPKAPYMLLLLSTAAAFLVVMVHAGLHLAEPAACLRLVAGALYLGGVVLLTGLYHVPRNDALAALDPVSAEGIAYWGTYLAEWVWMNHVRTVAPLVAALLMTVSLLWE